MAHPTGRDYDPLPLTHDQLNTDTLYNAPSPTHDDDPFRSEDIVHEFSPSDEPARPRFIGAALYNEGTPRVRDSYASSNADTIGRGSEYGSSVYGLNATSLSTPYHDDPHDPPGGLSMSPLGKSAGGNRFMEEKRAMYASPKSKRKVWLIAGAAGAAVLVIVVVVGVYFGVVKPHSNASTASGDTAAGASSNSGGSSSSGSSGSSKSNLAVSGGDGSTVTMEDGTTFTYNNPFGGTWYWDENDPFNNAAQAQLWSPGLNETFNYGVDKIRG